MAKHATKRSDAQRILVVYGTRPEAIKVAPVITAIDEHPALTSIPVVTGQHREMLDQVNDVFGITPVADLDTFEPGQGLNALAARIFDRLDPILVDLVPDAVVVQGDTTSAMCAAVAAFYRSIRVVHLEAGLRSYDNRSPFPEEANRRLISTIADLHLAPTSLSRSNLERENVAPSTIVVTGNTVIDALLSSAGREREISVPEVADAVASGRRILLVTLHRRENWGGGVDRVASALRTLSEDYPSDLIILPAHLNPVVRESILPVLADLENVVTCDPLPYGDFTRVLSAAHIVLTDSGGVQEEAPSLGTPVLVLRDNSERPEAITAGTVKLVGTDENAIISEVRALKDSETNYRLMSEAINPYGDGHAAERSAAAIAQLLGVGERLPDFA